MGSVGFMFPPTVLQDKRHKNNAQNDHKDAPGDKRKCRWLKKIRKINHDMTEEFGKERDTENDTSNQERNRY